MLNKKNILTELRWFLISLLRKFKKHSKNRILSLMNKKVYLDSGHNLGRVIKVILGENKIKSLKIKIDKKKRFKTKGIIIDYNHVKSVGEIMIIDEKILEHIKNYEGV